MPLVSVVTVNYRKAAVTCDLLDTLRKVVEPSYELILVDNGVEEDNTALYERHLPGVRVLNSVGNLGFAGGNNLGIAQARGQYVLLINNDTLVPPDFLANMLAVMEADERIGILSPKIYYHEQPDKLQYAGSRGINSYTGRGKNLARGVVGTDVYGHTGPTDLAHGACMMVRRAVLEQIGGLPEMYFMYYEEIDFCEQARRKGWHIYFTGTAYIHHRESATMGKQSPLKTYYLYRNRWLYMRRFHSGLPYVVFVLLFLGGIAPLQMARHWMKGEGAHARAILRGLGWHFRRPQSMRL